MKKNTSKVAIYKTLLRIEHQQITPKKIKYIRGKVNNDNASMVQVRNTEGQWADVTEKTVLEDAIM